MLAHRSTLAIAALCFAACSNSTTSTPPADTGTATDAGATTDTGAPTDAGSTTDTGSASETGSPTSGPAINGCTATGYEDDTKSATQTIAWGFGIATASNRCMTIKAGTSVTWNGSFATHPLAAHNGDASNPITTPSTSAMTTTVTFPTAGAFGYWCTVHQTAMQGVVQVVP